MRVDFSHISMSFGATEVLHDVSLPLGEGRITALLGENGAGKSTLMNILGGIYAPVRGQILIDGAHVVFRSPNDSIAHGIAFIHQELNPVNDLRVYENMFLGRELRSRLGLLKRKDMLRKAEEILRSLEIHLDATQFMRDLDASHKQIIEICRALMCDARLIIMDEPTTSLAEHEIQLLSSLVRRLAAQGVSIVFISHKLNEVKELCTDYAVLRNGSLVAQGAVADVETAMLSELIVGHELAAMSAPQGDSCGEELLKAVGLTRPGCFENVSFTVRKGEILGVTGLLGDGRSEVFRCVFGDLQGFEGELLLAGRPFRPKSAGDAIRQGIAYVPSNRKENALVPDMDVLSNGVLATMPRHRRLGMTDRRAQRKAFCSHAQQFHIKYSRLEDSITTLSGGNQQKVILARWLDASPRILVLDNPTQGVDIGARQDIYESIRRIAAEGVAVIVLSGESQEIVRVCARTLVMFHGRIAGELSGKDIHEQAIMRLATGIGC